MNEPESMAVAIPPTHVADLPALMHLASQLVPTGFLPDHIKTPGQAVAIILAGRELGVGPMLALRSIYMIKGKIELSADLQLSLFKRDGGRAHFVELTADKAQLKLNHPNGDTHLETFTMEDAKRAGLSGDNWRKYPKAMLRSRVITAALKSVGFEPKMSGCYAPGEVGGPEIVDVVAETVPPEPPKQTNGDKPLAKRINDMANWVIAQIGPVDGEWLVPYLRAHTPDGSDKSAALMPNEMLDALSEASLAAIKADPKGFLERVKKFAQENDQVPGAEVKQEKKIEVPRDKDAGEVGDWWKDVEIHFGRNKGTKLHELETKIIYGWAMNWIPDGNPTTQDHTLRRALDAASLHYGFTKKD